MGNKIAVRVKPLKQWSDVSNATRHGKREDPSKHVDRSRTHLNKHWVSMDVPNPDGSMGRKLMPTSEAPDIAAAFKDLAERRGAKWRKGAIVGTEMLFIASPDFFGPAGPERDKLAAEWAEKCLRAALKKYPGQVAAARLDLDETTPHFSIFLIPTYQKKYDGEARKSTRKPKRTISHNQVFGTPEKLSALQDWAAAEMKAAGYKLERGEPKTKKGPDHTTPAEGRRRLQSAEEAARRIEGEAEAKAAQIVSDALSEAERIKAEATPAAMRELQQDLRDAELAVTVTKAQKELIRAMAEKMLGADLYAKLRDMVNAAWKTHPENPDREQPRSAHRSSGPSGP